MQYLKLSDNIHYMGKTKEDKLKELKIPQDKWDLFSGASIDVIYDRFHHITSIEDTKKDRLLFFLNEILNELKLDTINNLDHFKVDRNIIIKIDGEQFVNDHRTKLEKYGIHLNNDLAYANRNNMKSYILTALKGICRFYGYELQSKVKTKYLENGRQNIRYYKVCQVYNI